ncbi:MAG: ParB/RepB/Spo0J family partition protein [Ruminococcus sp.]|nr:ParB/RepB/Spo0J family partition protein [Ruminococcus sp.]
MAKIDFTAMKNSRKAAEDQIEDNIPAELEESYTSVWGSNKENIIYIETTRLIPFVDKYGNTQPFKLNEKKVSQIAASAKDIGIVTPLTVRAKGDLYEIIAGHHRLEAAKQIGQLKVPCIVRKYTDEEMYTVLAESNIQRDRTLPSEYGRIFARYMEIRKSEDLTAEEIAAKFDISKKTMYRYINVHTLIPELQEMTDNKTINIAAVDVLAQLSEDEQTAFATVLEEEKIVFSAAMAKQLKALSDNADGELAEDDIRILFEHKGSVQKPEKRSISNSVVNKYFKPDTSDKEIEKTITKALEMYFSNKP